MEFPGSVEALLRRIRRGDELYHINSVVDVNNLISVKSGLSVGSYDLEKIHGAITLRKAVQGEGYTGIVLLMQVVYIGIRCYVKDWREERGYY